MNQLFTFFSKLEAKGGHVTERKVREARRDHLDSAGGGPIRSSRHGSKQSYAKTRTTDTSNILSRAPVDMQLHGGHSSASLNFE